MNIELLGSWAGLVWTALNENGTMSMKGLKKATKLKEKEIFAALGWLGREGKLVIAEGEADIGISLYCFVFRRACF